MNSKSTNLEGLKRSDTNGTANDSHWKAFVITSLVFCLVGLIGAFLSIQNRTSFVSGIVVISVLFGQSQLSAIFAAFSPQNYFYRLVISQMFLAALFFSFFGGIAIQNPAMQKDFAAGMVVLAICASHAPQLVFGFLRIFAGWRFHKPGTPRGVAYDLKDLFALTMFLAISISALTNSLGTFDNETAEGAYSYFVGTGVFAVATLVYTVPTIAVVYRVNNLDKGFTVQLIVIVAVVALVGVPLLAFGAREEIVGAFGALVSGCCVTTWLPLVILRQQGFVLTIGNEKAIPTATETGPEPAIPEPAQQD